MFETKVFRKQMYFTEESTCDIVENFRVPIVIRRPGNCAPLVRPRYAPDYGLSVNLYSIC